jgi:hypothetical protein
MKTLLAFGVFAASGLLATAAGAGNKAACLSSAANGQTLRDAHKLVEAREQFRICASAQCPAMVQGDCGQWLADVDRSLPSVVITAKNWAGADRVDVRVTVDGQPLLTKLDGEAIPMNPGEHTFHFEEPDGTQVDQQVVVREGEKNQNIGAVLGKAPPPTEAPRAATETVAPPKHSPMRPAGLVIGGIGVAGLATGAVLGLLAASTWSTAKSECPTHVGCSAQAVSDQQHTATLGTTSTVLFVAGGVFVAAGVTLFLTAPKADAPSVGIQVSPDRISLAGAF